MKKMYITKVDKRKNSNIVTVDSFIEKVRRDEKEIHHNFYDDPKFSLETTPSSKFYGRVNGVYVSDSFFQKAQDYNNFRDIADTGMLAVASDNALKTNKKSKKSLFESQNTSIFGNI